MQLGRLNAMALRKYRLHAPKEYDKLTNSIGLTDTKFLKIIQINEYISLKQNFDSLQFF